jgi:glycosyltransferase involved in cell wall biosynthesis
MKVLLIAPLPPPIGGIAAVTSNLLNHITKHTRGINLLICNTSHKQRSVTSQSVIIRLYTGITNAIRIYSESLSILRKDKPNIIHLTSSASLSLFKDYMITRAARRNHLPIIVQWHFGRIPLLAAERNWEWKLLCHIVGSCNLSLVTDTASLHALRSAGFKNIQPIPNPVSPDVQMKSREEVSEPKERFPGRVIFVGHIMKSKGVYDLIEACCQLSSVRDLILIGPCESNVRNELTRIAGIKENGIWLKFMGYIKRNEVLDFMCSSPILALPSHTESFPNVLLEAMALGCAIVGTEVGAIPEILDINGNAPCGICVPVKNIEKLKLAIAELLDDHQKTAAMGRRGIERVLNNYSIEKVAEEYKAWWKNTAIAY